MALSKMSLLNIIGKMKHLDEVVYALGSSGVFQPDDTAQFYSDNDGLLPVSASNDYSPLLDRLRTLMEQAGIVPDIVSEKEFKNAPLDTLEAFVSKTSDELGAMADRRTNLSEEIREAQEKIESSKHFLSLDIDIEKIRECQYIATRFGKLPKESYLKLKSYDENPFVEFFPCTSDEHFYWGVYVVPLKEASKVDRIFSRLYFEEIDVSEMQGKPAEYAKAQEERIEALQKEKDTLDEKIAGYAKEHRGDILKVFTALCKGHAYLAIKNHACRYNKSFILVGWIPSEYEGQIKNTLSSIKTVDVSFSSAKDEVRHSPPVKLKNRFFAKPFEYYTEMYGLPNYREIDPSGFIALTYVLLFGIMFADLGQGFFLLLASIFMYKVKKMPLGRLLIPCSVSSMIFGTVFGSVFGFEELLNPVYKALFGLEEKPVDVMEGSTTMILIYGAVGVGVVLLIIAMILNIISSLKRGDPGNALFGVNGVAGLVFYAALVAGLLCSMMFGVKIMTTPYILCLIVLPLLLVFLREPLGRLITGKKKILTESVGSFFVDNFFELFEVLLSYVTNTMSFLRVGAFVLVHAGMMQVVFVLAEMFGAGGVGYYLTVIIGNILVMVLEALLVGIQVLRLEYYEMFNRFYIGDGRKFEPVTVTYHQ